MEYMIDEKYIKRVTDYHPELLPRPTPKMQIILVDTDEGRSFK